MYILAALGFAFIFNMLGTINLAHGSIYMIGAYLCYSFCAYVGLPTWVSMLISAVIIAAFGLLLERFRTSLPG
jgi:branched-chain amino acid transport system permease protein